MRDAEETTVSSGWAGRHVTSGGRDASNHNRGESGSSGMRVGMS